MQLVSWLGPHNSRLDWHMFYIFLFSKRPFRQSDLPIKSTDQAAVRTEKTLTYICLVDCVEAIIVGPALANGTRK